MNRLTKKQLKKLRKKEVLKKIKYVGVEFEPTKIDACEREVNEALAKGYKPIRDIDTPRGLVIVLGLWQEDKSQ